MKKSLAYINRKCGYKYLNDTKEFKLQYLEHLLKNLIFL